MNTQSNALPDHALQAEAVTPVPASGLQLLLWSVRRELWEYRFLYIVPIVIAGIALLAFTFSAFVGIWEPRLRLYPAQPQAPYDLVAGLLMGADILVTVFYCLDALYGERRDRSILFWKSLPVSDSIAVLSKAAIPLAVMPLIAFAVTVALHWLMLMVSLLALAAGGQSIAQFWANLHLLQIWLLLLYHLVTAHALWPAPVYCWLLLVSAWARRAPFLWAAVPVLVITVIERIVFGTWRFSLLVISRLFGDTPTPAHTMEGTIPLNPATHITPGRFLAAPGLWIGFLLAAVFLAAAIRLRRYQGPI
jgi:ABC-2 type transport system permease protein